MSEDLDKVKAFIDRESTPEAIDARAVKIAESERAYHPEAFPLTTHVDTHGVVRCRSCNRPMMNVPADMQGQLYAALKYAQQYCEHVVGGGPYKAMSPNEVVFLNRELGRVLDLIEKADA